MVDTINPNTNQPDSLNNDQATTPENRFYGGFDKPDETKINLADSQGQAAASSEAPIATDPSPQKQSVPQEPQPVHDVAPVAPAEVKHTSYVNTANNVNWRGVIVIFVVGLLLALLIGLGLYFGLSAANNSKIEEQEATLEELNEELVALRETPDPLELPEPTEPVVTPEVVDPVIVPPVVTPTPVETQETEVPDDTNNIPELG
jgi:hypothetical protein